jgi:hypothetical protein
VDSEASNVLKKLTWANLKSAIKTYADGLYAAIGHDHAATDIDSATATDGYVLTADGAGGAAWEAASTATGDVVGPASSVDNAIPRFDSTTGKLLQCGTYNATISDEGNLAVNPTWNAAGTTFTGLNVNVTNTASAAGSLLADFQVGAGRKASINKAGDIVSITTVAAPTLNINAGGNLYGITGTGAKSGYNLEHNGIPYLSLQEFNDGGVGVGLSYTSPFGWATSAGLKSWSTAYDLTLYRDAAHTLAQRLGTNAQTHRIYNTYTNASNYERGTISWGSNLLTIGTEAAGTGTNRDMEFNVGGSKLHIKTDGTIYLDAAGQTVGNARGAGSVDLQPLRNAATKVASGTYSAALGIYNTASGSCSYCPGGSGNIASADQSGAMGLNNTASANYSFAAGQNNTITGINSTAFGYGNSVSGRYSLASGNSCTITSWGSIAAGSQVSVAYTGAIAFGWNTETTAGCAQGSVFGLYTKTTDATATILNISSDATNRIVIPAKRACTVTGLITAYSDSTDGYKVASWEIKCVIERNASNTTRIVGTPTITLLAADTDAAGWAVTSVTADDTNEALAITVTGEAATAIRWQASLFYGQVGYA